MSAARAVILVEGGFATLIDVRCRGSLEGSHIQGALSVSLEEIETASHLPQIEAVPANHLLVFYCT
jgi:rhodanese-related sulfurtransferase